MFTRNMNLSLRICVRQASNLVDRGRYLVPLLIKGINGGGYLCGYLFDNLGICSRYTVLGHIISRRNGERGSLFGKDQS